MLIVTNAQRVCHGGRSQEDARNASHACPPPTTHV